MNLCFIYSFVASYNLLSNSANLALLSRKPSNQNTFDYNMAKGVSPFRINRRTTIEIKIDDTMGNRSPSEIVSKINRILKNTNAHKLLSKRPIRHYPNHYYKRLIKQKRGFQLGDARRKALIAKQTQIDPKDDIGFLRDKHLDKILEAVDSFDQWTEKCKQRNSVSVGSDQNANI
ncbi:hypothetical protein MACK_002011 [Theileria orientalis]|uniref:Uncharacterized protein n=1 Tax=Theileria orientalis TaxID=68886 RepID=A0A976MD50_THEOR|nr:hypothetical protein MACK_002011 [Theileria orientalis]